MKKKIGIFTTTRGDMAILTPLIKRLKSEKDIKPYFFAGGTHNSKDYGDTINEIKELNIKIDDFFNTKSMHLLAERAGFSLLDVYKTKVHGSAYVFVLKIKTQTQQMLNTKIKKTIKTESFLNLNKLNLGDYMQLRNLDLN